MSVLRKHKNTLMEIFTFCEYIANEVVEGYWSFHNCPS